MDLILDGPDQPHTKYYSRGSGYTIGGGRGGGVDAAGTPETLVAGDEDGPTRVDGGIAGCECRVSELKDSAVQVLGFVAVPLRWPPGELFVLMPHTRAGTGLALGDYPDQEGRSSCPDGSWGPGRQSPHPISGTSGAVLPRPRPAWGRIPSPEVDAVPEPVIGALTPPELRLSQDDLESGGSSRTVITDDCPTVRRLGGASRPYSRLTPSGLVHPGFVGYAGGTIHPSDPGRYTEQVTRDA